MNLAQIYAFLMTIGPFIEPMLLNIESGAIQPELQKLIAGVTNPELKAFLTVVDAELDKLVQAGIAKI